MSWSSIEPFVLTYLIFILAGSRNKSEGPTYIQCLFQGGLWLISGIILNGLVCGAVFRPVGESVTSAEQSQSTEELDKKKLIDWSLLKNPAFLIFCLSSFFCLIGKFSWHNICVQVYSRVSFALFSFYMSNGKLHKFKTITIQGIQNSFASSQYLSFWHDSFKIFSE